MRGISLWGLLAIAVVAAVAMLVGANTAREEQDRLWHYRNLGKAFYENPTTQKEAVEEFRKALALAPKSAREQVNYGLALLRAGRTKEGIAELEKAQKLDPGLPHTWFNLGIVFKKEGNYQRAVQELEQMAKLVPDEPVTHYNLGTLYKLTGKPREAVMEFETAARLNPNLAGPHFQLFNAYRQAGRSEDSARELEIFKQIKKRTEGAAVPEDMEWSYFAEIYDPIESRAMELPPARVKFEDRAIPGRFTDLAVLDFNGDGKPDILAWSDEGVKLFRNGTEPVASSGLDGLRDVVSMAPGDFDNDGLADLCVITRAGAALYHNNHGAFQKTAAKLPEGHFDKAVWMDYDHDYDLDLILLGPMPVLLRNNNEAGFSDQTAAFPFVKGNAVDGTIFAVRADTAASDLAVVYQDRTGVIYRDRLNGKYEAIPMEQIPAGAIRVAAEDFDNDGFPDIAAVYNSRIVLVRNGDSKWKASTLDVGGPVAFAPLENRTVDDLITGASLYRNQGAGNFAASGAAPVVLSAVVAEDFDGDGRADLAGIAADGALHLLRNQTVDKNRWFEAGLTGVKNLKLASGATVEIKAGASYQKKIYRGVPLLFGTGPYGELDTVRITWPNGLIQNEPKQMAARVMNYKEAQRLSGSCPMIFTWDGTRFRFITDVLGVAPLGASSGDGHYFPVDHDEYVQIPGEALKAVDGHYEIRISEELREVSYLDQVRLIALDHPGDVEVFTNDKFKSPPFPEFRLFGTKRRAYPVAALDNGEDALRQVLRRDRIYPDRFRRDYSGIAELHHLDLDFGGAAPRNRAVLILNGWVDWADGSTFLQAAQRGKGGLILPYLQVKNARGEWQTVIEDMGIPAGKPKTIAVDLTGKFLTSSREVRIVTNLCVYWDEIFLSEDSAAPDNRMTPIDAESADLHFRGFSRPVIHPERKQPEAFDYGRWMPVSAWNPTPGLYTRYGDVLPLVRDADDQLIIMGSGDELRLFFSERNLPALPAGWRRDFLLLVDGWAKDADANTAFSQTVEPLPFHAMSAYPYPPGQRFPDDAAHRRYREQYNTRPALRLLRPLRPASTAD